MTTALAVIVDTSVICALALVICRVLHRRSAALRHVILAAALAVAATVPLLETVIPRWEFALLPDDATHGLVYGASAAHVAAQAYGCGCFWFRGHAS